MTAARLAFVGPSGVGKTSLLEGVVAALAARGVRVVLVKHTRHPHALDRPGKDSWRLRRAGAAAVAVTTPDEVAVFAGPEPDLDSLAGRLPPADLLLVEGGRDLPLPKVEVHRRQVSPEFLCESDAGVVAVVTDEPSPRELPTFRPADAPALAHWIAERFLR